MLPHATAIRRDTKLVRESIEADIDVKATKKVIDDHLPLIVGEIERVSSRGRFECNYSTSKMSSREISILQGILTESGYQFNQGERVITISW